MNNFLCCYLLIRQLGPSFYKNFLILFIEFFHSLIYALIDEWFLNFFLDVLFFCRKIPEAECEVYKGKACDPLLAGKKIYVDPFMTQDQMEAEISQALGHISMVLFCFQCNSRLQCNCLGGRLG